MWSVNANLNRFLDLPISYQFFMFSLNIFEEIHSLIIKWSKDLKWNSKEEEKLGKWILIV